MLQAVANSTSATFLRVVGSELIQKYLGDGPKLVRELFRVADDLSPSIVFIDEIDAVGTKRWVTATYGSLSYGYFLCGKIIAEASHEQIDVSRVYDPAVGMMLIQEESVRFRELCWSC